MKQIGVQHLDMLTDSAYGKVTSYSSIPHPVGYKILLEVWLVIKQILERYEFGGTWGTFNWAEKQADEYKRRAEETAANSLSGP